MSANQQFPILDDKSGILTITGLIDANGLPLPGPLPTALVASSTNAAQLSVAPVAGQPAQFLITSNQAVGGSPVTETITVAGADFATGAQLSSGFDFVITHDTPVNPPVGFAATFVQNP
jgi:hypothetical protein